MPTKTDELRTQALGPMPTPAELSQAHPITQRLSAIQEQYSNELFIVMRTYFEKPRTVIGWKGLITDPA